MKFIFKGAFELNGSVIVDAKDMDEAIERMEQCLDFSAVEYDKTHSLGKIGEKPPFKWDGLQPDEIK